MSRAEANSASVPEERIIIWWVVYRWFELAECVTRVARYAAEKLAYSICTSFKGMHMLDSLAVPVVGPKK